MQMAMPPPVWRWPGGEMDQGKADDVDQSARGSCPVVVPRAAGDLVVVDAQPRRCEDGVKILYILTLSCPFPLAAFPLEFLVPFSHTLPSSHLHIQTGKHTHSHKHTRSLPHSNTTHSHSRSFSTPPAHTLPNKYTPIHSHPLSRQHGSEPRCEWRAQPEVEPGRNRSAGPDRGPSEEGGGIPSGGQGVVWKRRSQQYTIPKGEVQEKEGAKGEEIAAAEWAERRGGCIARAATG